MCFIFPHYLRVNSTSISNRIKAADTLLEPEVFCIMYFKNSVSLHVRMLIIFNLFIHKGCKLKYGAFSSYFCNPGILWMWLFSIKTSPSD